VPIKAEIEERSAAVVKSVKDYAVKLGIVEGQVRPDFSSLDFAVE